jgi:hypothetical protein
MVDIFATRATLVWLLVASLTLVSWFVGSHHHSVLNSIAPGAVILLFVAFFKIRLVILYFMEIKHAPLFLRLACEAWVIITCLCIFGFYYKLFPL